MQILKKFSNSKLQTPKIWNLKFWALSFSKGFTLVEILVVISIIGTLASLTTFSLQSGRDKGNDTKRKADLKAIQTAAVAYYQDHNQFPPDPAAHAGNAFSSDAGGNWIPGLESYINSTPKDPKQAGLIYLLASTFKKGVQTGEHLVAGLITKSQPMPQTPVTPQVAGVSVGSNLPSSWASIASGTLHSWSHSCSGSNVVLVVGTTISNSLVSNVTVTNITYGGSTLTKVFGVGQTGSSDARIDLWYLKAPLTGTNTIDVTLSAAARVAAGAMCFTDVDQATPISASNTSSGTGSALSVTVAAGSSSDIVVDIASAIYDSGLPTLTVDASQTQLWNTNSGIYVRGASSYKAGTAGNVTMNWTQSKTRAWRAGAIVLKGITNNPPTNGTLTAAPPCVNYGTQYRFTTTVDDPDGYGTIIYAYILINNTQPYDATTAPVGAFSAVLNNQTNDIGIRNDANTAWYWAADGINGNSYATLNRATSTHSGSGTTLTTNWDITFNSAWQPENANVWIRVSDGVNPVTAYSSVGTVQIPCPGIPQDNISPWTSADVGTPLPGGQALVSSGNYDIYGDGTDIWDPTDNFRFAYQAQTGDFTAIAQITSIDNTDNWAKAGLMVRSSTTNNSANIFMAISYANGIDLQYRAVTGGANVYVNCGAGAAPKWVKIAATSGSYSVFYSDNGTSWTQCSTALSLNFGATPLVGMAVTSHNGSVVAKAQFRNVSLSVITPAPIGTISAADPSVPSGGSTNITWSSVNATSCTVSAPGWTGTSGNQSTGPLTSSQTYTLNCTGPGGNSAPVTATVTISAAPTADIKANGVDGPITVNTGDSVSISWTSTDTTTCMVTGGPGGSGTTGSFSWTATTTTTFSISCTGGSATDNVVVNVALAGAANCPNIAHDYCFLVTTDRSAFVIWAQLDDTNDQEIYNKPNATCTLTPPAVTPPGPSPYNYCVQSPSL